LITWPILTVSIVLVLTSIVLALFILLHKSRGGGLSDLFGGGMTTGMSGTSVAERNLDRMTIVVGLVWLASVVGLLVLYRFFPDTGTIAAPGANATPAPTAVASAPAATSSTPAGASSTAAGIIHIVIPWMG